MGIKMSTSRLQAIELQLEEAIQLLRLAAQNKRTCLELQEWLDNNYPDDSSSDDVLTMLKTGKSVLWENTK